MKGLMGHYATHATTPTTLAEVDADVVIAKAASAKPTLDVSELAKMSP
jgi:hypothetical protein